MSDTRNLRVLEAAIRLAESIHDHCRALDGTRAPGMRSQLLRAADSVPANIAEGTRGTPAQRQHFYRIARGSADEVGAHLRVAVGSSLIQRTAYWQCENRRVVVCKMLTKLIRALEEDEAYEIERSRRLR